MKILKTLSFATLILSTVTRAGQLPPKFAVPSTAASAPSSTVAPKHRRARTNLTFSHLEKFRVDDLRKLGTSPSLRLSDGTLLLLPSDIYTAYQMSGTGGKGQRIAIVDAYGSPSLQSDLDLFCDTLGVSRTRVKIVNVPAVDDSYLPDAGTLQGWSLETSLDVEWAHVVAPDAEIVLYVAASDQIDDLLAAVDAAAAGGAAQISSSWGSDEFGPDPVNGYPSETAYDIHFKGKKGVTFVFSSGDDARNIGYPATSPYVMAVGGTSLYMDRGRFVQETGWNFGGGGPSKFETASAAQIAVTGSHARIVPDVSYNANPETGFPVIDTFAAGDSVLPIFQVGGTSAGAPQWAAILALANARRTTPLSNVVADLYNLRSNGLLRDITVGASAGYADLFPFKRYFGALIGFDNLTGLGSPLVFPLVAKLAVLDETAPSQKPDVVIAGLHASNIYLYADYKNIGGPAAPGDPGFVIRVSYAGRSFDTNSYYPYSIPSDQTVRTTGGITLGLIGLTPGLTNVQVTACIVPMNANGTESNQCLNRTTTTLSIPR